MTDDTFTKFRSYLKKNQREILDRLHSKHSEDCRKLIRDQITRDQQHTVIVNMCAYAFSESGPLVNTGYHFIKVEPLYKYRGEKGNKIFDLVLYNKEQKRAILIECKSSIGNPSNILTDLNEQIENTKKHKDELENEIGGEINDIEYVICAQAQDIEEVGKILKDEPVCLWSVDLFNFTIKLHNFSKSFSTDDTSKLIKKKQLHAEEKLREKLYKKTESTGQIEGIKITPSSHFCRILSRVFVRITQQVLFGSTRDEKHFLFSELIKVVQQELSTMESADVHRISEEISQLAQKLKLIEITRTIDNPPDSEFDLKVGARTARVIEQNIEEKYIEEKCKERSPKKAIEEYKEYVEKNKGSLNHYFSRTVQEQQENSTN